MNDNLEPIRRVFRSAGLYHHAADDLLCGELAAAVQPQGIAETARAWNAGYEAARAELAAPQPQAKGGILAVGAAAIAKAEVLAASKASPQPQAAGEWVMVPRKPTEAMALAAVKASLADRSINGTAIYAAMLAAAPQPQAEPVGAAVPDSHRVRLERMRREFSLTTFERARFWADECRMIVEALLAMAQQQPRPQASAEDVAAWAQRLDDGYDSAESPAYVEFYRKDVVESVIREMRASLGVGRE